MNIYLKQQLLIHASAAAKDHMKDKAHALKERMPKNISKKNALKVARLRAKKSMDIKELQNIIQERVEENEHLLHQVKELEDELSYFRKQYGERKHLSTGKKEQLQTITSLQRELIDQQLHAKELLKSKKINHDEYYELINQYDVHQKALRKKKQKLLTN